MKSRRVCPGIALAAWAVVLAFAPATARAASDADRPLPTAGPAVPEMAAYDRVIGDLMRKWRIPGGAVAVAKDGCLALVRGYGLADVEKKQPVEPDALFRIASLSKPITAAAVLVLVEQGRLNLDARALDLLGPVEPLAGKSIDPRFRRITVRHLLEHTAGFDRDKSFDPMFRSLDFAQEAGTTPPADRPEIVRCMLGRALDFEPGERYAYSNFGYCLLGRILERVTGQSYDAAVKSLVLRPAGITRMELGHTRRSEQFPGEVCYYPFDGSGLARSVFPDEKDRVPAPYGGFYVEAMDAHGGWVASAVDLMRFMTALDGSRKPALLHPETLALIEAPDAPKIAPNQPARYGLGWIIHPWPSGTNWSHTGSLPGTATILVRTHQGMAWAALFNCRPRDQAFFGELDRAMWEAVKQVKSWPRQDLFPRYR